MQIALRIVAYLTFLLGLALVGQLLSLYQLSGLVNMFHMLLGIATAILALVVIGGALRQDGMKGIAAVFPLLPLAIGLIIYFNLTGSIVVIAVHALLGITAIGLIESYLARRKRAQRAALGQR